MPFVRARLDADQAAPDAHALRWRRRRPMPAMSSPLPHRRLWSIGALSAVDLRGLLETAAALKQTTRRSSGWQPLRGRHLALLCAEPSAASALFIRAVVELGGSVAMLHTGAWLGSAARRRGPDGPRCSGSSTERSTAATCRRQRIEQIDRHAGVPVFNGLASSDHPMRLLCRAADACARRAAGRWSGSTCASTASPGSPLHRAADALLSLAGCALHHSALATAGTSDEAAPDVDFVLDTSAPAACGRLVVPNAPAVEQARVNAVLIGQPALRAAGADRQRARLKRRASRSRHAQSHGTRAAFGDRLDHPQPRPPARTALGRRVRRLRPPGQRRHDRVAQSARRPLRRAGVRRQPEAPALDGEPCSRALPTCRRRPTSRCFARRRHTVPGLVAELGALGTRGGDRGDRRLDRGAEAGRARRRAAAPAAPARPQLHRADDAAARPERHLRPHRCVAGRDRLRVAVGRAGDGDARLGEVARHRLLAPRLARRTHRRRLRRPARPPRHRRAARARSCCTSSRSRRRASSCRRRARPRATSR